MHRGGLLATTYIAVAVVAIAAYQDAVEAPPFLSKCLSNLKERGAAATAAPAAPAAGTSAGSEGR